MRATREQKERRKVGVREAPGLYCTSAHMRLPAAAVNVMIALPSQSQLLMGKGHVVFHAFFNTYNHPRVTAEEATHDV